MKLSECKRGDRGHLRNVEIQPCYQLRVQELGLRSGAQFVVTNRAAFGGVVLNVGGARVAVDARSSKLIDVEVAK
ncbi:MAG: FeoA family protein [Actinomycetaceae bacterium]|nr:FeoA family protein [Actinomycetaceae bacterium]